MEACKHLHQLYIQAFKNMLTHTHVDKNISKMMFRECSFQSRGSMK